MPQYPGVAGATSPVNSNLSPILLSKGVPVYVLGKLKSGSTQLPVNETNVDFEAAPAGATESSIAVCLQGQDSQGPPMVCVEIAYASAPGASEQIAIQESDTDADAFYITPSAPAYTVTSFNSNNVARVDLSPTGGKLLRVVRTKGANAVGCTVKFTRLA